MEFKVFSGIRDIWAVVGGYSDGSTGKVRSKLGCLVAAQLFGADERFCRREPSPTSSPTRAIITYTSLQTPTHAIHSVI